MARWLPAIPVALVLAIGTAATAFAQDVENGKRIAQQWCSNCHVVDPVGQKSGSDAVPTFRSIANMKSTTPMSLNAFLSTTHGRMPNFALSRYEIQDVSAYILTLRAAPSPSGGPAKR